MLVYCLTSNLIFTAISTCVYLIQGPVLQFYRALPAFLIAAAILAMVAKWNIWRGVSHFVCLFITVIIWSNLLVFVQGVNIPTLQFVFLIMVYSFYVHGLRWGFLYSLINVAAVVAYTTMDGRNYFAIQVPPQAVSKPAFLFVITYNFLILVFLHFIFSKPSTETLSE